jgi:Spy/CpxP family protein refolding chaperone
MRTTRIWQAGIVCGVMAAGAPAQESSEGAAQSKEELLAGPEVREDDTALPADFTGASQRAAAVISAEAWMRIVRSLDLTDEQTARINTIEQEVRQAMLEFRQTYGEELREFERLRREAVASGKRPTEEMQRRYAEINKLAPSPVEAQEKIWALLTEEQQTAMSARLEELRQRMIEERQRRAGEQQNTDVPMDQMMAPRRPGDPEERTIAEDGIDHAGQRRLRFLRQRQLSRPPGAPPTGREREFQFDDEDRSSD